MNFSRGAWLFALAAAPVACGGAAFSAGPGDGSAEDGTMPEPDGEVDEGSVEHDGGGDTSVHGSEGGHDATPESSLGDGPSDSPSTGDAKSDGGVKVTGTVVDPWLRPLSNVTVMSGSSSTTTGANGTFSLAGLTTPYDVIVVTSGDGNHAHVYEFQGLDVLAPVLELVADAAAAPLTASVSGSVLGGPGGGANGGIAFVDPPPGIAAGKNWSFLQSGSSSYNADVFWASSGSETATIYALNWQTDKTTGFPLKFGALGSHSLALANGGTPTYSTTLTAGPAAASVKATTTVSASNVLEEVDLYFRPSGAVIAAPIAQDKSGNSPQTYDWPAQGGQAVLCARQGPSDTSKAYGTSCASPFGTSTTIVTLTPPAPTSLKSPATTGVTTSTSFNWSGLPGGIQIVTFASAVSGAPEYFLVTAASSGTIPNVSSEGLPSSASYTVSVTGFGPFASVDAAVTASGGFLATALALSYETGPATFGQVASSDLAPFTTQ